MTKTNSATKRTLALILAMLMMFSGMAVSASADVSTPTDAPTITAPEKPTYVLNETDKKVTITRPAGAQISISPVPSDPISVGNTVIYINLVPGTKYTVKAFVTDPVKQENLYSPAVTFTVKDKHNQPNAPVPKAVTSTSITISSVNGCEYRLTKEDGTEIYKWGSVTVFDKGLTPNTPYIVSIRVKETDTKYASDPRNITVKTLKAGDKDAADIPVLVDKTNKTIIVKEVNGVKFSIDKGKTWQSSGTFTGLTPNTIYGIIARKNYDPAVQDPNPVSEILEIRTNSREKYAASTAKCKFTIPEGKIYANKEIKVSVTADGPKNIYDAEYGDTRLVPDAVIVTNGKSTDLTKSGSEYVGYITPGSANANSELTVTVIFKVLKFDGEDWVSAGTEDMHPVIEVGPNKTVFTVIGEFFVSVANLFLNTIPQFFTDIFSSEIAAKLYEALLSLLGKLGEVGKA